VKNKEEKEVSFSIQMPVAWNRPAAGVTSH